MIKICPECGGLGYIEFPDYDYEENILDSGIQVTCDLCQGEGFYKSKSKKYLITVDNKKYVLDIECTIDRQNNPLDVEIIETWVFYNFGHNKFKIHEIREIINIDEEWNIENYR